MENEELAQWHFTNLAQRGYGYSRRDADLLWRNNFDRIARVLKKADDQVKAMNELIKELS